MFRIIAAALLAALASVACDPCAAALEINLQRCAAGNAEACLWVDAYMAHGTCPS